MSRTLIVAAALAVTPLLTAAAGAQPLVPGDGFQLEGTHFFVVSVDAETGALFRVSARLEADGVEEHVDCYRVGRAFYHVEACPVLQAHFARHGAAAESAAPLQATTGSATGSHPIDYLRGGYVEQLRSHDWGYGALYYGHRHHGRRGGRHFGFGFRGHRGRFGHAFVGGRSLSVSFRRW